MKCALHYKFSHWVQFWCTHGTVGDFLWPSGGHFKNLRTLYRLSACISHLYLNRAIYHLFIHFPNPMKNCPKRLLRISCPKILIQNVRGSHSVRYLFNDLYVSGNLLRDLEFLLYEVESHQSCNKNTVSVILCRNQWRLRRRN